MKYNEKTTVTDLIQSALTDWNLFCQSIVNQDIYSWLIKNSKNKEAEKLKIIHSDIGSDYPHLAALYIFNKMTISVDKDLHTQKLVKEFLVKYDKEINKEKKDFSIRFNELHSIIGSENSYNLIEIPNHEVQPQNDNIIGFLLVNDGYTNTVCLINKGSNTYGTTRIKNEPLHHFIVSSDPQIKGKHFSITTEERKLPNIKVFDSCMPFVLYGTDEFREGPLDFGTELTLSSLKITIIKNQ